MLQIKSVDKQTPTTKRGILSFITSIFDPLGILAPSILEPKLIVQELWRRKIDWDEKIPVDLEKRWLEWKSTIDNIRIIEIPRWYNIEIKGSSKLNLHVFADASDTAYGSVAYVTEEGRDKVNVSFILAKSRLAPIKESKVSIPKLELQAALIASRLKNTIVKETGLKFHRIFLWTDSKTVINYLRNTETNFGIFVAHRVNEIRELTSIGDWNYVPTKYNPADDTSRYIPLFKLEKNHRWLNGPDFLKFHNYTPETESVSVNEVQRKETKEYEPSKIVSRLPIVNWNYYSSFDKLVRHIAWILKLKYNWICSKRGARDRPDLTRLDTKDINNSVLEIVKLCQAESYPNEFKDLEHNKQVNKDSNSPNTKPVYPL